MQTCRAEVAPVLMHCVRPDHGLANSKIRVALLAFFGPPDSSGSRDGFTSRSGVTNAPALLQLLVKMAARVPAACLAGGAELPAKQKAWKKI